MRMPEIKITFDEKKASARTLVRTSIHEVCVHYGGGTRVEAATHALQRLMDRLENMGVGHEHA